MQGEPTEPRPEDPDAAVEDLRRQIDHLRRWFEWERWLLEPRSFAPPEERENGDSSEDD